MLIDLAQSVGDYLHDVFIAQFDWWVLLGYVAQIMFTMRFVVQWIASERRRRSHIPRVFWYLSIAGSALSLTYAIYLRDPPFIFGQSTGMIVYLRNLMLLNRESRLAGAGFRDVGDN